MRPFIISGLVLCPVPPKCPLEQRGEEGTDALQGLSLLQVVYNSQCMLPPFQAKSSPWINIVVMDKCISPGVTKYFELALLILKSPVSL